MESCISWLILILALYVIEYEAAVVRVCNDEILPSAKRLIYGSYTGEPTVVNRLYDIRSKVECAICCHDEPKCNTAVYHGDGCCLLIKNVTTLMNITHYPKDISLASDIIPVRFVDGLCPSTCVPPAVCMFDCTDQSSLVPVCVDLSNSSYVNGCQFNPVIQSREYYFRMFDKESSVNGFIYFTVTFSKQFSWSVLKVMFRGVLRSGYGGGAGGWARWRIYFNETLCASPGYIEGVNYNNEATVNHHKSTGMQGICYNLPAGNVTISLRTSDVTSSTLSRIGYGSYGTRLFVEELNQTPVTTEPPVKPCPGLSIFNTRTHTSTGAWAEDPVATIWNVPYTKMEASTGLRINLDFVVRLHTPEAINRCQAYIIRIDNQECSPNPISKILAYFVNPTYVWNEHRSVEIEGHCFGISDGLHTLSLIIGACTWGETSRDAHTGWNGENQRWIIEEFRLGTNVAAVISSTGSIYKVPQFNIQTAGIQNPDFYQDTGLLWTLPVYTKMYSTSGLRITMSSGGRCYYSGGSTEPCCRHFFVLNGAECANPGPIEGIHYLSTVIDLHRPIMVDGICEGIPAGTVSIQLHAGICRGHSNPGDCQFGYNSVAHVMMSETFVDREIYL